MNVVACVLLPSPLPPFTACARSLFEVPQGKQWLRGGEPTRLTAVVHRRAEFLRPSPAVPIRGLRCVGRVAVAVLFAL